MNDVIMTKKKYYITTHKHLGYFKNIEELYCCADKYNIEELRIHTPVRFTVPSKRKGRCKYPLKKEGNCKYCGSKDNLTIDHVFPRSLGGKDNKENLQVLCYLCNSRKGNTPIEHLIFFLVQ